MINKRKSVEKTDVQIDNPFETNRNTGDLEETAEDMEDSKLGLSSRMSSPCLNQKSNRLSEKNAMSIEANQEKEWRTIVYGIKRHILFVQIVNISEKNMGKKVGYLLEAVLVRNQEIRIDFSQITRRDQARKILTEVDIELFLIVTDGIANQMAGQKKVLVKDIPLDISNREVGAAMKEFGKVKKVQIKVAGKWQLAVVEFNTQEETTRAVDQ
ncbi:hypothetical protein G9A89_016677 [Geosiphon pyriformis]|nr:hypothetical protein G9A89_016677 [Geosiphon pyriformis]